MDSAKAYGGRIVALDVLRGLAVAGMILVTSPGSWDRAYAPLKHAAWRGWTPADLVFPTFLFCVGMAIGLSVPRLRAGEGASAALWLKVARRTALLILLGLALNALPSFDLAHLRIPGVLQRIGLCYALASAICILPAKAEPGGVPRLNLGAVVLAAVVLLVGYWALLTFTPVPGFGADRWDSQGALPAFIDRAVFTLPHLWPYGTTEGVGVTYDPEGLLSTLPATVNVLLGAVAAAFLARASDRREGQGRIVAALLALGATLIVVGLALDPIVPVNKRIWTPSFALFSSGASLVALIALHLVLKARAAQRAAWPLKVLGGNAILAFVVSQVLGACAGLTVQHRTGVPDLTPQGFGFETTQRLTADPYLASFLCALAILALIIAVIAPLDRRGIHLRL
ncbi:heparan-alpha-glucosaminide N-acetyltransferase domain-containing protein [Caulobacter sp. BE254]|uniref:acyltransferase family protein n=1 Tax=Caulobacter sp. BE254 TaxID=2817720 RepID=UPI0028634E0F|nr:heparan-alpha-glucosaminide N-acetyltransferase domain-containing protein [Caulobacter sp. BE254]MDR7117034.1 putative acyltransferase [Caulobacter sp. BE254]